MHSLNRVELQLIFYMVQMMKMLSNQYVMVLIVMQVEAWFEKHPSFHSPIRLTNQIESWRSLNRIKLDLVVIQAKISRELLPI